MTSPDPSHDLDSLLPRLNELRSALAQAVVGQHEVVEQLLIGLLAGGHCLLERALAGAVIFFQQFGTEDVAGHQVGGELHTSKLQFQGLAE